MQEQGAAGTMFEYGVVHECLNYYYYYFFIYNECLNSNCMYICMYVCMYECVTPRCFSFLFRFFFFFYL